MLLAAPAAVGMICLELEIYGLKAIADSCLVSRHNIGMILLMSHILMHVVTPVTGLANARSSRHLADVSFSLY